jgi:VWFA-related protein
LIERLKQRYRVWFSRLVAAVLLLVSAVPAGSQSRKQFTLKTTTEVVLVNVTARDKDGGFVRDLKAEDFTVLEDGRPQKILSLDVENTDAIVANDIQVPNLLGTITSPSTGSVAAAPAAAAVAKELFRDRRLMVLFFDLSSMQPEETKRAAESAENYVDKQMKPADLVAVVTLQNTLRVAQDFSSDREALKAAMRSLNPDAGTGFAEGATGATAAEEGVTDDSFTADDSEYNVFNTDRRLDALKTIAETLAGIEQKKSLLYFSAGMSQTGIENQSQLRAAANAAVRANMSIYTVDVRGLQALPPGGGGAMGARGGGGGSGRGGGSGMFSGRAMQQSFDSNFASQETLVTLASDTGGKAFLDTNDFRPAFSKIQEDTTMYYVLGYTSSNEMKDGRFRRITVSLKRKDVKLDFRRGYYAEADFQHTTKENREAQLEEQLASDLPGSDLPVYLSTGYFRLAELRYFVPVSLVVPGSAIPFTRDSDQDKATLDIAGVVRDQRGRVAFGNIRDTIKLAVNTTQEIKRKNVQYDAGFLLPPGSYNLKFVLRENQTGQVGSFEAAITVPNLRDAPVKISSVIASSQKQAARAKKDNPLYRNGSQIIPSVTHVFSPDQHLDLFYEVYEPERPQRILTNASFFKGNTKVFETPLVEATQINTPERKAATIELDVPLASLKPGFYTCQVNVIDDAAGRFVFPRMALLVR